MDKQLEERAKASSGTSVIASRRERKKIPPKQRLAQQEEHVAVFTLVLLDALRIVNNELTQILKRPSQLQELLDTIERKQKV